jgi:hypothetical protein
LVEVTARATFQKYIEKWKPRCSFFSARYFAFVSLGMKHIAVIYVQNRLKRFATACAGSDVRGTIEDASSIVM